MHYGASVSEVADCTAATSHSSRATQTRGGCIGSAILRFCSVCVSRCLVRLDSVIGERGCSSFSMVDSEDSSD